MTHFVDPSQCNQLNMRTGPKPASIIVSLPAGTNVEKLAEHGSQPHWWRVRANLNGVAVEGFVSSRFLAPGSMKLPAPMVTGGIPPAHLRGNAGKTRRMNGGRAFPLDEPSMPVRTSGTAAELIAIINFLDPGKSTHS